MLNNVKVGETYCNVKTGHSYLVLEIAKAAWDINQELVVYAFSKPLNSPDDEVWVRSMTEFKEKFSESEYAEGNTHESNAKEQAEMERALKVMDDGVWDPYHK